MDLGGLKGRIAEALVESILRRAGYQVSRLGRESQVHRLIKVGADEFLPDFLVWKPVSGDAMDRHLHRLLTVEVKYRANLIEFLRRHAPAVLAEIKEQWPADLHEVPALDVYPTTVREYEALVRQIFPLLASYAP
jgi:hypothetical protein